MSVIDGFRAAEDFIAKLDAVAAAREEQLAFLREYFPTGSMVTLTKAYRLNNKVFEAGTVVEIEGHFLQLDGTSCVMVGVDGYELGIDAEHVN